MKAKISIFSIFLFSVLFVGTVFAQTSQTAQTSENTKIHEKGTGVYFEIELATTGAPSVIWKNWRDKDKSRNEADVDGNPTITIIANGYSYSLSPNIKVARKSKIVTDEKLNPLASKYAKLADIPQLDPLNYASLIKSFGAVSQGPTEFLGQKAELYNLKVQNNPNFPWNNFLIWINAQTQLPMQIQYNEGTEARMIKFIKIEKDIAIQPSMFDLPKDYKVIEFEWD